MALTDKINIISVPENVWRMQIRPALLENSDWRPQDDKESINDFVFRDPVSGRIVLPKYFWHATINYLEKKIPNVREIATAPKVIPAFTLDDVELKDGIAPRDYQQEVIDKVVDEYNSKKYLRAIVKGSTGFGKTFVALYTILYKLKLKPIIIVHNEVLFQQWYNAILNYFNIDESRIGRIQGSDLDKIEKEVEKDILIVKSQSLLSQVKRADLEKLYELYNEKGKISCVIFDEAHLSSAALKFAKPSALFATPNVLALSATPFRKGIHKLVMLSTVGDNIIESSHVNMIPEVDIKIVDSNIDAGDEYRIARMPAYVQKLGIYNNVVTNEPLFIENIVVEAENLVKTNHRTLIIAANNTMVEKLVNILKTKGINAAAFTAQNREYGDADVIVSNQQMSSTGFSQDDLSALILANGIIGKTQLIQSVGRVLRLLEGKKDPRVVIFLDKIFLKHINENAPFIIKRNLESEFGNILKIKILEGWKNRNYKFEKIFLKETKWK